MTDDLAVRALRARASVTLLARQRNVELHVMMFGVAACPWLDWPGSGVTIFRWSNPDLNVECVACYLMPIP